MAKAQLEKDSGYSASRAINKHSIRKANSCTAALQRRGRVRSVARERAGQVLFAQHKPGSLLLSPALCMGGWVGTACFLLLFTLTEVPPRPVQLAGQGALRGPGPGAQRLRSLSASPWTLCETLGVEALHCDHMNRLSSCSLTVSSALAHVPHSGRRMSKPLPAGPS